MKVTPRASLISVLIAAGVGLSCGPERGTVAGIIAALLGITTQPSASAETGVAFATQPVIQLRDASSNPVSQAGVTVSAAIATGGGTLNGTTTANTNAGGLAAFTDLAITGTPGPRTLTFSAPNLTSATSGPISITAATAGTPVVLEDFSTYTSTANLLADPRGIWDSNGNNTSRIALDETVGYGTSTKSMRYDWPNNGPNCLDYGIRPGFLIIPGNQTHVWIEFVVRFGTTFKVDHGAPVCAQEYKLGVLGDIAGTGRWNFPEMQAGLWILGYPGNEQAFQHSTPLPSSLWDGQPHVYRLEARLGIGGPTGILKFWIDGVLIRSASGFPTSVSHTKIDIFGPGANLNQGPNIDNMKIWWHRFAVYTTNPGW